MVVCDSHLNSELARTCQMAQNLDLLSYIILRYNCIHVINILNLRKMVNMKVTCMVSLTSPM
jgi:hypothetical protein